MTINKTIPIPRTFVDEQIERLKQHIMSELKVSRKILEKDLVDLANLPPDVQLNLISELRMSYPTRSW